jgi:hypothetical protein
LTILEFSFRNSIGSFPVIHEISEIYNFINKDFFRFPNYRILQLSGIEDDLKYVNVSPFFSILFSAGKAFVSKGIRFDVRGVSFYNMSRNLFSLDDIKESIDLCFFHYRGNVRNLRDVFLELDSNFFSERPIDVRCLYLFDLFEDLYSPMPKEEIIFENKLGNFKFVCEFSNLNS